MQLQTGIHTAQIKRNPQTRIVSIGIVVALHIVALYAILNGFVPNVFKPPGTVIDVVPTPPDTTKLPPPPPPLGKLVNPTVPVDNGPVINIDRDAGNSLTPPPGNSGGGGSGQQSIPSTAAEPLVKTHTIPPYPTMAIRLNEQGTVTLRLEITADGSVSTAAVQTSSGSDRLDAAAIDWVKAHWRYKPATRDGAPVATATVAAIRFDLRNAR